METEKVTEAPETGNPKEEYPPKKQVIPAMVAIYLTVFLIALVSDFYEENLSLSRRIDHN